MICKNEGFCSAAEENVSLRGRGERLRKPSRGSLSNTVRTPTVSTVWGIVILWGAVARMPLRLPWDQELGNDPSARPQTGIHIYIHIYVYMYMICFNFRVLDSVIHFCDLPWEKFSPKLIPIAG